VPHGAPDGGRWGLAMASAGRRPGS